MLLGMPTALHPWTGRLPQKGHGGGLQLGGRGGPLGAFDFGPRGLVLVIIVTAAVAAQHASFVLSPIGAASFVIAAVVFTATAAQGGHHHRAIGKFGCLGGLELGFPGQPSLPAHAQQRPYDTSAIRLLLHEGIFARQHQRRGLPLLSLVLFPIDGVGLRHGLRSCR